MRRPGERRGRVDLPRMQRRARGRWARVATLVAAVALSFALVKLQIFATDEFALIAKENRLRPIVVHPPRGTIFDRYGQVVAENRVGYQVLLMPAPMDSMKSALKRLQPVLALTAADVEQALRRYRREPHLPMVVQADAPPGAVARLLERRFLFPGVLVHEYPKRYYPAGDDTGHLLGYVAEISREELMRPEFRGYRQGRWIGKAGLERYYESKIGGEPGMRYLEVDAIGRIKRWLPEEAGTPSIPGRDLQLHLDLDLQRYVAELFRTAAVTLKMPDFRASLVAIEPQTGGVLAMYATPNYDPNQFVGGVRPEIWRRISQNPANPLLDRAAGITQPPGSTFKMATASMALSLGVLGLNDYMPVACTGGLRYERRYARCWYGRGHGALSLVPAIKNSCNVYFYQVGIRIGLKRFVEEGARLGYGRPTGIDLPNELPSSFPTGLDWWQRRFGYKPYENEIMSLAIGQGLVSLSPLKLATIYVALSRPDGKSPAPRLAVSDSASPIVLDLGISPKQIHTLRKGLRRVVGPGGTAAMSRLPGWDFMGKTGTAQTPQGDDHAWFVGMGGPFGKDPEIVAVMLIEHGEHGYSASGVVANAINFYLNRKHGQPFERFPTPRERIPRNLTIDWSWYMSEVDDPPMPEP